MTTRRRILRDIGREEAEKARQTRVSADSFRGVPIAPVPPQEGEALVYRGSQSAYTPEPFGSGGGSGPHAIISSTHTDTTGAGSLGEFLIHNGAEWDGRAILSSDLPSFIKIDVIPIGSFPLDVTIV